MRFLVKGMSSKKLGTIGEAWSGIGNEEQMCFGSGLEEAEREACHGRGTNPGDGRNVKNS
jgi:hypothetical protein